MVLQNRLATDRVWRSNGLHIRKGTVMRRLIFGCGYLGFRVASFWRDLGDAVTVVTRSTERARGLRAEGFRTVLGDVMNPASLASLPSFDTALYAVGFDRLSGFSKRSVYVDGLKNALSACYSKCERLVFISSTSVYGQSSGEVVDESSATDPTEEGGAICAEAEALVQEVNASHCEQNNKTIVLRLSGIYGPGRVLARIEQLMSRTRLTGNPNAWLNLIHVEDAAAAAIIASEHGQLGGTYLVSDDRPIHRYEYYRTLAELVGAPEPLFSEITADSPERLKLNKRCSNKKLREQLGVKLRFPTFIEGLNSLPEVMQSPAR